MATRYRNQRNLDERDAEDEIVEEQDVTEDGEPELEASNPEEETFKKRYGDLRRYSQKVEADLKAELDRVKAAAKQPVFELPKTEAEVEEWSRKYPDLAAMIHTIARKQSNNQYSESGVEEKVQRIAELERKIKMEAALKVIEAAHPDFHAIRMDKDFHNEWVAKQAQWVKTALYDNDEDAQSVIDVLDLYKAKTGKNKAPVPPKEDGARTVTRRGQAEAPRGQNGAKFSESQVEAMSLRDYEKNEDAIQAAIEAGQFTYDITGGAR